jgi:hypothetical protein
MNWNNQEDIDIMLIDIESRFSYTTNTSSLKGECTSSDYIEHEVQHLRQNTLMMKSQHLPYEEDVYFNNNDQSDKESTQPVSDKQLSSQNPKNKQYSGNSLIARIHQPDRTHCLWNLR